MIHDEKYWAVLCGYASLAEVEFMWDVPGFQDELANRMWS